MNWDRSLRSSHPVKVGDYIDGQTVIETYFKGLPSVPFYRLEDRKEYQAEITPELENVNEYEESFLKARSINERHDTPPGD